MRNVYACARVRVRVCVCVCVCARARARARVRVRVRVFMHVCHSLLGCNSLQAKGGGWASFLPAGWSQHIANFLFSHTFCTCSLP